MSNVKKLERVKITNCILIPLVLQLKRMSPLHETPNNNNNMI